MKMKNRTSASKFWVIVLILPAIFGFATVMICVNYSPRTATKTITVPDKSTAFDELMKRPIRFHRDLNELRDLQSELAKLGFDELQRIRLRILIAYELALRARVRFDYKLAKQIYDLLISSLILDFTRMHDE